MSSAKQSITGRETGSVLIVNDLPEQLALMYSLLNKAGYAVITAADGQEALEVAKRERPDLVISDVTMPRLSGIEFCRRMREDAEMKSTPILLASAHRRDTESVVQGLRSGADDYLEVPFDATRLIAKVSRLLERSRVEANYRDLVEQAIRRGGRHRTSVCGGRGTGREGVRFGAMAMLRGRGSNQTSATRSTASASSVPAMTSVG